jgi:hypothetical protein
MQNLEMFTLSTKKGTEEVTKFFAEHYKHSTRLIIKIRLDLDELNPQNKMQEAVAEIRA